MRGKKQKMWERKENSGYTLVEMVIVLVVTGILVTALAPVLDINLNSYMTVRAGKESLEASRIAFNRMISEMRRIQTNNDIIYISRGLLTRTWSMEFQYLDENGNYKRAEYGFSPSNLWIWRDTPDTPSSRFIEGVTAFTITCYKSDGTVLSPNLLGYIDESQVWRIGITITLGSKDEIGVEYTLTQEIHPKAFGI